MDRILLKSLVTIHGVDGSSRVDLVQQRSAQINLRSIGKFDAYTKDQTMLIPLLSIETEHIIC